MYYPHTCDWVSQWSLSLWFPHQNPVYTSSVPNKRYIPRPSHSSRFDHPISFGEQYRSFAPLLCSFLHFPVTSSLLGPNILLNTLFSNNLIIRSFLNINDQVSHPYKTTRKIIVLNMLIFKFFDRKLMTANIPWLQSALNFFLHGILIC